MEVQGARRQPPAVPGVGQRREWMGLNLGLVRFVNCEIRSHAVLRFMYRSNMTVINPPENLPSR